MQTARLILAFINVFLPVVTAACSACEDVALTWNGAQLQTNKLSTSEIRYTNVGTFEGRRLDLVVKKLDPNTNVDCSGNGDCVEGSCVCRPGFGGAMCEYRLDCSYAADAVAALKAKATVDLPNGEHGFFALYSACQQGNLECARLLIEAKSAIDIVSLSVCASSPTPHASSAGSTAYATAITVMKHTTPSERLAVARSV